MVTCWRTNDDLKNGGVWPPLKFFVDFIKRIESYYILCLHIACTYVCGCSIAYTSYSNSLLFSKPKIFGERLTLTILHMVHIRVRNPILKVRYVWPWFLFCYGALVCFQVDIYCVLTFISTAKATYQAITKFVDFTIKMLSASSRDDRWAFMSIEFLIGWLYM